VNRIWSATCVVNVPQTNELVAPLIIDNSG
jgi:hypothetical protein